MSKMTKAEVGLRFGFKTARQVDNDNSIMALAKIDGRTYYWESEDIDKLLFEQRVKQTKEKDEKEYVSSGNKWGGFDDELLKYFRYNTAGFIVYCRDIDNNLWADAPDNFFSYSPYIEDIERKYLQHHQLNKQPFLLSKIEYETGKIEALETKWKKLKEAIMSNHKFVLKDITQFSNDKDEMKYNYIDLNSFKKGKHKHWDIWESQIRPQDRDVYKAFIYSIFVAKNRSRQVLWLTDVGDSGKTKTMNAIGRFGGDHFSSSPKMKQLDDKHYATYFDKYRLVLFDDMENPFFLSNSIIKTVTGSGQLTVDRKGADPYVTQTNIKMIIGSNHKPILSGQKAEETRLILIEVQPPTKENYDYMTSIETELDDILVDELPAYLYDCKKVYERLCPGDGKIRLSEDNLNSIRGCQDLEVSAANLFINSFFIYNGGSVDKKVVDMAKDYYKIKSGTDIKYEKILQILSSNNVKTEAYKDKGLDLQKYKGLSLNSAWKWDGQRLLEAKEDTKNEKIDWDN